MPRRLLVALFVSLAVLLAVIAYTARPIFFPPANHHITQENYDRLREGMKREEVEAILGPPGDYRTIPTEPVEPIVGLVLLGGGWDYRCEQWIGNESVIELNIYLSREKGLRGWGFRPIKPEPIGLIDLVRWRWSRWREFRR
jgi:hypothetical protein